LGLEGAKVSVVCLGGGQVLVIQTASCESHLRLLKLWHLAGCSLLQELQSHEFAQLGPVDLSVLQLFALQVQVFEEDRDDFEFLTQHYLNLNC
jgi:hypothetical protein